VGLDFDHDQGGAIHGDDVDFTHPDSPVAIEHTPTAPLQIQPADLFGPVAESPAGILSGVLFFRHAPNISPARGVDRGI
jgi:hypothetical protein